MNTTQVILIKNASFHVNEYGLMASEDMERYFPIDGLHSINALGDIVCIENILPFQITQDGMQHFYTISCQAETVPEPADSVNYYELEEREDVEEFIKEMDSSIKGCFFRLAVIAVIIITLLITMCK